MGFFETIKKAISLDEDDDDVLYEMEMLELEKKERASRSRYSGRNSNSDDNTDEDERASRKKSYRNSNSSSGDSESGKTAGKLAQERREASSSRKTYESSRTTPPRSPQGSYSSRRTQSNSIPRRNSDDNVLKIKKESSDISIIKVKTFTDAQDVCDSLIDGRPIIVTFDDARSTESQRIMDFISGCVYVLNGNLHTISDTIFLFSPNGVDVSGDYINMVQNDAFGIPTFNKMF